MHFFRVQFERALFRIPRPLVNQNHLVPPRPRAVSDPSSTYLENTKEGWGGGILHVFKPELEYVVHLFHIARVNCFSK